MSNNKKTVTVEQGFEIVTTLCKELQAKNEKLEKGIKEIMAMTYLIDKKQDFNSFEVRDICSKLLKELNA